jgi:hypothetical protein
MGILFMFGFYIHTKLICSWYHTVLLQSGADLGISLMLFAHPCTNKTFSKLMRLKTSGSVIIILARIRGIKKESPCT